MKFRRDRIPSKFNRGKDTAPRSKRKILSQIYAEPQSGRRILKSAAKPQYEQTQAG